MRGMFNIAVSLEDRSPIYSLPEIAEIVESQLNRLAALTEAEITQAAGPVYNADGEVIGSWSYDMPGKDD